MGAAQAEAAAERVLPPARLRHLPGGQGRASTSAESTTSSTTSCGPTTSRTTRARGRISAQAIERTMGDLDDVERAKILGLNCARFLGDRRARRVPLDERPDSPRQGRGRRGRRDDLLQARPGARAGVQAGAAGDPRARARTPGIDPRRIDGFASYSNDRNDPSRLAAALGLPRAALLQHAVGRRWWRRLGGGRQRGRRDRDAATPTAWSSSARWPRASSSASAQAPPGGTVSGEPALNASRTG